MKIKSIALLAILALSLLSTGAVNASDETMRVLFRGKDAPHTHVEAIPAKTSAF